MGAFENQIRANETFESLMELYKQSLDKQTTMEEDIKLLRALEAAGVDNWEGYDLAREEM